MPISAGFFELAQPKRQRSGRSSMPVLEPTVMWFPENPKNWTKK
jgi:hypothetical protein